MHTRAGYAQHPFHIMLVGIPIGLLIFSFACDVVVVAADFEQEANLWFTIGYFTMAGGLAGAFIAAIPRLIDLVMATDREVRKIGATHTTLNLIVIVVYVVNLWLRTTETPGFFAAMGLSLLGIGILAVSAALEADLLDVRSADAEGAPVKTAGQGERAFSGPAATRIGRSLEHGAVGST